jgi:ribose 5-phosphate isomerase B
MMTSNVLTSLPKKIAIGSDHVGYDLKEDIRAYLVGRGIECQDFGAFTKERTDYPLFARQVARYVASREAELGILICGTGVGMAIAANKTRGIRAVSCSEPYSAALSRQHNNTNILAFGARVVGTGLARMIVEAWLAATYEGGRHARRVEMIHQFETGRQESLQNE